MATTHTHVSIGGNWVNDDVLDIDIWYTKSTGVASCRIVISNVADKWGSTFNPNDAITVTIDPDDGAAAVMFVGFVDNVKPFLGRTGVLTNKLEVTGRNQGRYLVDYYLTKNYKYQASGVILNDIINVELAVPLTFVDPGGTPSVKYNCLRTKVGTAVQDISQLMGYDSYIDTAGTLEYFPAGSVDSGVNLICLPNDDTNNLLAFEEYEQIGVDIKNRIEVHAGSVKDHWTEENAADWSVEAGGGVISDETATYFMFGIASIKVVDAANDITVVLDFPAGPGGELYSYSSLDMTKYGQAKVVFRPENGSVGSFDFRPVLIDGTGKQITFTRRREGKSSKGYTENVVASREAPHPISFPVGAHDENETRNKVTSGYWHAVGWVYVEGVTEFDWSDVDKLGFQLVTGAGMDTVYFDALYIPSLQARTVQTDAASVFAYGTRMYSEYRSDLKSQNELDAYGAMVLDYKKDSIQKFRATARGQTGTRYVAQTVHVRAPDYGIFALTPYIIVQLHHILHKKTDVRGFDFITQYELVSSDTQPIRVVRDNNPVEAALLELYARLHALEAAREDEDYWIGDVDTGITTQIERGPTFPLDMRDGDEFFLTADLTVGLLEYYGPALYKYDDTAGDWIRNPIFLNRAAVPNAGGEVVGDTLYITGTGKWYRWDGGPAWLLIVVSGSSLLKGVQPFDSAMLFEPIRANAAPGATFNVDVNGVGANAIITAAAGTFSDFAPGDEITIQNAEDSDNNTIIRTVDAVGGGGVSITLNGVLAGTDTATDEQMTVSVMDAIKWTNNGAQPEIWFADGDTQHINSGSAHGLLNGAHWVYFTVAVAALTATSNYPDAVGDDVGVICRLETYNNQEPLIFPFYSRGGNMSGDAIAFGSVDTLMLTSEEIIGKWFSTAYNVGVGPGSPAGVVFNSAGIFGYGPAAVAQFWLRTADGSAMFSGGKATIDTTGITINDTTGDIITFMDDAGLLTLGFLRTLAGRIVLGATAIFACDWPNVGDLLLRADTLGTGDIALEAGKILVDGADVEPDADQTRWLGVPGNTFLYAVPKSTAAQQPLPVAALEGLLWYRRGGGATAGVCEICMQNLAGGYEWVTLGST